MQVECSRSEIDDASESGFSISSASLQTTSEIGTTEDWHEFFIPSSAEVSQGREPHELELRYRQGEREFAHNCLRGADLRGANLRYCNLEGADFRGADLSGANFEGTYLATANLISTNLSGASLRGAALNNAILAWSQLTETDLRGADLRHASFDAATLCRSKFKGANLSHTYLKGAVFEDNDFAGAYWEPNSLSGGDCMPQVLETVAPITVPLVNVVQQLERLSQATSVYIGKSLVAKYWGLARPQPEWLNQFGIYPSKSLTFITTETEFINQEQLYLTQEWINRFLKYCSQIVPELLWLRDQEQFVIGQ